MPHDKLPSRIYLTGFMGSGKTTVGEALADLLRYRFIDLDELVECRAQASIPEIFATRGEKGFRTLEAEALRATNAESGVVVGTGGGTLLQRESMLATRAAGPVVYLRLSVERLASRLEGAGGRPLLSDEQGSVLSGEALRATVARLLRERAPAYERADFVVDSDGLDARQAAASIFRLISGST